MIDGSVLWIRPNSTVVIRNSNSIFGGTNVRVALDEGQLNVRTQDSTEGSENIVEVKETENYVFLRKPMRVLISMKTQMAAKSVSVAEAWKPRSAAKRL